MREAIVKRVDHVYVPLQDARRGFPFLTETLVLPVTWPFRDFGGFASGGVFVGNVNLEVAQGSSRRAYSSPLEPARVRGIAFEPLSIDEDFLAELDRRGIGHSQPNAATPPGASQPLWTTVEFDGLIGGSAVAFACQYHFPSEWGVETKAPSTRLTKTLAESSGGPLGIIGVSEIVVGSPDPVSAARRWQLLLDPTEPAEPGMWRFEVGPALRVVEAAENCVEHIVLAVRSVESAVEAAERLAIAVKGGQVLVPEALEGLSLELQKA
jgi:hypothetical protein